MPGKTVRSEPRTPLGRSGMTATGRSSNSGLPSSSEVGIPFISARVHLGGSRTGGRGRGSVSRSTNFDCATAPSARVRTSAAAAPSADRRAGKGRRASRGSKVNRATLRRLAAEPAGVARAGQQIARRAEEPRLRPQPAGQTGPRSAAGSGPGRHERTSAGRRRCGRDRDLVPSAGCIDCGRLGQPRAQQETDPLGRPLHGREYGDDYTVKVPGEIDVQRARRIIEELRRRLRGTHAARASSQQWY